MVTIMPLLLAQMYAVGKPYFEQSYPQRALYIYQLAAKAGAADVLLLLPRARPALFCRARLTKSKALPRAINAPWIKTGVLSSW